MEADARLPVGIRHSSSAPAAPVSSPNAPTSRSASLSLDGMPAVEKRRPSILVVVCYSHDPAYALHANVHIIMTAHTLHGCYSFGHISPNDLNQEHTSHFLFFQYLPQEDNPVNNKLLCNILKLQYTTFSAVNGKEAVDYVEREPFDAVLMDIQVCERTHAHARALAHACTHTF